MICNFEQHGYYNIAIYGVADFANRLSKDLEKFGTEFKMYTGFFNYGIINGKKERLIIQRIRNCPDCF